jgi:hypothetical protein
MGMGEQDAPAYISSMVSTYVQHIDVRVRRDHASNLSLHIN